MIIAGIFFFSGLSISIALTLFSLRWSQKGIGLDAPDNYRKQHDHPIPRIGGIPLFIAFIFSCLYVTRLHPDQEWVPILICCSLIFGIGLWDDFSPLGAKVKLIGQILAASLAYYMGMRINMISHPESGIFFDLTQWSFVITLFWLVAVPNVVNLIDGIDGLATGLGIFLFMTLAVVAWLGDQFNVAWISVAMVGALLGFLFFNFPPAKIFLGDGGAYLIGFSIAMLSLKISNKGAVAATLLVTIVALGLPIIDTAFALLRRALRGFPIFRADAEHIHHRLQRLGLSQRRIVLGMYFVCVVLSLVALSIFWTQGRTLPIAIGIAFVLTLSGVRYLRYIGNWADLVSQISRSLARRPEVQYTLLQAKLMEMEVDRCDTPEEFFERLDQSIEHIGFIISPERISDRDYIITMEFDGRKDWILRAPSEKVEYTREHWQRLAECFRTPYSRALHKWDL